MPDNDPESDVCKQAARVYHQLSEGLDGVSNLRETIARLNYGVDSAGRAERVFAIVHQALVELAPLMDEAALEVEDDQNMDE